MSAVSGVAAAALALLYAHGVRAEAARAQEEALARYGGELTAVCVATRDIDPGEQLDEGNVRVEEWVASLLPPDAVTSLREVSGKTATSRIPRRAVLSPVYTRPADEAVSVPEGMVAVSVACDEQHALGGALERGSEVDVYLSRDGVADRLARASVVDSSVLASNGGELSWVTLAVDPSAVRELLAATARGAITLTSPGSDDGMDADAAGSGDGADAAESQDPAADEDAAAGASGGSAGADGEGGGAHAGADIGAAASSTGEGEA